MDKLNIKNIAQEAKSISQFIKKTISSRGFRKAIIATSGGIDSATSLFLTSRALGAENVYSLMLPYGNLHSHGVQDARLAVTAANIPSRNVETVDIQEMVDTFKKQLQLKNGKTLDAIRIGNIMARCRMIILYDRAKKHTGLVVGTENKSEHYLSYFTRFGDEASDIEPIKHLYKTQVYQMAKYLNVPDSIVTKAPTAGLWPGQTDEGQFGFTYALADQILHGLYDKKYSVVQLTKQGFKKKDIEKIKTWVETNWFKHELPITYKH